MTMDLPIGIDDFKKLREGNLTYVDKTLLIETFIQTKQEVQLITRPRRFGKTLNLSTLAYFFDQRFKGTDIFNGLAIADRPCFEQQGTYPVISLTFKNLKANTYEGMLDHYKTMIMDLYEDYEYLYEHLSPVAKDVFLNYSKGIMSEGELSRALPWLMKNLNKHHGQRVILLLDEYDSPLHEAVEFDYLTDAISFIRSVLGQTLKGNKALEKALLTGILRIAKESIFSDLNHIQVFSTLDTTYADMFGFTEDETLDLLKQADLEDQTEAVRYWYNGYKIGDGVIYNPWSLISYLQDPEHRRQAYWVNTSSNRLVHKQLLHASTEVQVQVQNLMNGGTVTSSISDKTVFRDLQKDAYSLWSLLLFSGYLTLDHKSREGTRDIFALKIPNKEVLSLFHTTFGDWLENELGSHKTRKMLEALITGNSDTFGHHLADLVPAILSYYDTAGKTPERVYHVFVLGLLAQLSHRFTIRSNRESGLGRYDLMMLPKDGEVRGIVMEFKAVAREDDLDNALETALAQIQTQNYAQDLKDAGVNVRSEIAVAFCGKKVRIKAHHTEG